MRTSKRRSCSRRHILPNAGGLSVVAGVMASDPTIDVDARLIQLHRMGVHGVTNWLTVGFIDGKIRAAFDENGCGLSTEIEMPSRARKRGMATFAFVLNVEDMRRFAAVGVDAYIINAGLTLLQFAIGDRRDKLQDSAHPHQPHARHLGQCAVAAAVPELWRPFHRRRGFRDPVRPGEGGWHRRWFGIRAPAGPGDHLHLVRRCKTLRLGDSDLKETGRREMLGRSASFRDLVTTIERVAPFDANVVIEGETGVGKELAASLIHERSPRAKQPFITLNCGAIPRACSKASCSAMNAAPLPGPTGAGSASSSWPIAAPCCSTKSPISALPPRSRLLRVLQQREVVRVGADNPIPLNVRVIAATNRALADLVREGKFRSDLYYRLSTVTLNIPPLRDRLDDLPVLMSSFLQKTAAGLGMPALSIDKSVRRSDDQP